MNSIITPHFKAFVRSEDVIFYSHSYINGLFKMDLTTLEIEFVAYFEKYDYCMENIHAFALKKNNSIIFFPAMGNSIDIYNYEDNSISSITLNRYKNDGEMVCDVCQITDDRIIIFPYFFSLDKYELPVLFFDTREKVVTERWDINNRVKELLRNSGQICTESVVKINNEILINIYNSNHVLKYNFINNSIQLYNISVERLNSISVIDDNIYLTDCDGRVFEYNQELKPIREIKCECGHIYGRALGKIIKYGKNIVALPEMSDCILTYREGRFEKLYEIDVMRRSAATIKNYFQYNNKIYFTPDNTSEILYMDIVSDVIKSIKHEDVKYNGVETKKILKRLNNLQIDESRGYDLEGYIGDIISTI